MKIIETILNTIYEVMDLFRKEEPVKQVSVEKPAPAAVEPAVVETIIEEVKPMPVAPKVPLYKTIPMPSTNRSMAAAVATLKATETLTGVKARDMALIINIESSFDYTVKAKTSSATGWFQFIDRTWNVVLGQYGKLYDIPFEGAGELRLDPRISALMGAELIKENIKIIRPAIGRDLSLLEIYLAHFFGSGNAKKFLLLRETDIAAERFPKEAKANAAVFFNKSEPRTVAEIKTYLASRIKKSLTLAEEHFK